MPHVVVGQHAPGLVDVLLGPAVFLLWGAIIGAIWDAIKWVANKAADLAILLAAAAKQAGLQIWNAMKALGRYSKIFAGWVKDGFEFVWVRYLKPAAEALWHVADKVSGFLRRVLGPVVNLLKRVQGWLRWAWDHVLSPIINAIEFTRAILQLLGRLGFEWAVRADAWLADLERRIVTAFGKVTGWVNGVLGFLWQLMTPEGLLNQALLWGSIEPHAETVLRMLMQHGQETFTTPEAQALIEKYPPNIHADMDRQLATGEIARRPVANITQAIVERIYWDKT